MVYWIKRWMIWIYRWRHCRGFGVQSPSDYSFIRYVINEHYPYYAYDELYDQLNIGKFKKKKAELLFRIANWKQAKYAILLFNDDVYRKYIHYGCRKTVISSQYVCDNSFLVISALDLDDGSISRILDNMRHDSLVVIDNLNDKQARKVWKNIIADDRVTISFDLYYIGIVMTIDKRYKHNYIVNF